MTLAGDVGRDFHAIREPDTCNLPESGVWFLRRHRRHLEADTALQRGSAEEWNTATPERIPGELKGRSLRFSLEGMTGPVDELIDRWHWREEENGDTVGGIVQGCNHFLYSSPPDFAIGTPYSLIAP
jgi:hypothetical protein